MLDSLFAALWTDKRRLTSDRGVISYRKLMYSYSSPLEISPSQYADSTHRLHSLSVPRFGSVPECRTS